jgi:hypothetical protein
VAHDTDVFFLRGARRTPSKLDELSMADRRGLQVGPTVAGFCAKSHLRTRNSLKSCGEWRAKVGPVVRKGRGHQFDTVCGFGRRDWKECESSDRSFGLYEELSVDMGDLHVIRMLVFVNFLKAATSHDYKK